MDGGLVTARIHQGLICTPLDTHRYLVLPGLIGGSPRRVGDPDQQSHLHHGTVVLEVPRVPASPAGRPRPYRRPSGRRVGKGLPERVLWRGSGLRPPPSPGVTVGLAIPTPWRGSRGHRQPRPGSGDGARERGRWEGRGKSMGPSAAALSVVTPLRGSMTQGPLQPPQSSNQNYVLGHP